MRRVVHGYSRRLDSRDSGRTRARTSRGHPEASAFRGKIFSEGVSVMTEMNEISVAAWNPGAPAPQARRRPHHADDIAGRWVPPAAWVAIALLCGPYVPAWAWMWLVAVAVFAACKWATWWPHRFDARAASARHAGFLLGYAGMDAERFLFDPPAAAP